jgi:hypothetical protein
MTDPSRRFIVGVYVAFAIAITTSFMWLASQTKIVYQDRIYYVESEPAATPDPTVTITVTPTPRPTQASRASREKQSVPSWATAFRDCVINHESAEYPAGEWPKRPYDAENPTSSASGAFQFVDGTWKFYASELDFYPKYKRASDAPAFVQDAVFFHAILQGDFYHWNGTDCGHGT